MKIAFLDRDGTLIVEPADTKLPTAASFEILPGALSGLKKLKTDGYELVIVSNQGSGSPQSYRESCFRETQNLLEAACKKEEITFLKVFMCPHTDADQCGCRKPKNGMVSEFLDQEKVDLGSSLMIGDRETDGGFAKAIGVRFIKANGVSFPEMI